MGVGAGERHCDEGEADEAVWNFHGNRSAMARGTVCAQRPDGVSNGLSSESKIAILDEAIERRSLSVYTPAFGILVGDN
jgi:hypothetical protein